MSILFEGIDKKQRKTKSRKVSALAEETKLIGNVLKLVDNMEGGDDFSNAFIDEFLSLNMSNPDPLALDTIIKEVSRNRNVVYGYEEESNFFYVYLGRERELVEYIDSLADDFLDSDDKKKLIIKMWK